MNIAVVQFYFYPDVAAVSQLLGDLLGRIAENPEYKITVFCGTSSYFEKKGKTSHPKRLGNVFIRRIKTLNFGKESFISRFFNYCFYYIYVYLYFFISNKWDAIVCLTTPPFISFVVALALLFRKVPLVYYIQDLYPEILYDLGYIKNPWLVRKLLSFSRIALRRSNHIITIGEYMKRKISRIYSGCKGKITVISNWGEQIPFQETKNQEDFVVMYSGNMGLAHDFTLLPGLIERLKGVANIRYRFIGGGGRENELKRIFKMSGEHRVSFERYARRVDVGKNLSDADVLLMAQREEVVGDLLPSKLYSYLACGRPMLFLGPKSSEIGEILINNDIGVVLESERDVDYAASFLDDLVKNPVLARQIGLRARDLYERRFGLDQSTRDFQNLITSIVEKEND